MATELTKTSHLQEHSTGLIAIVTDPDSVRDFEKKLTIQGIVKNSVPLSVLKQAVGGRAVSVALDIQLTRLVGSLSLKWTLNDSQIKTVVEDLLEKYPNETLEDFMLCFKKARQGEYGELIRLDGPIIFSWMETYLDQKYQVIEDNLAREKDEYYKTIIPENSDRDWLGEWQNAVNISEGVRAVPQLSEEEIEKEGQEKPNRDVYRFNESEAQVKLREAHAKIFECQERAVRERHDDWTEEEIQAHLKHLRDFMIQEETKPKLSPVVERILKGKKRKSA